MHLTLIKVVTHTVKGGVSGGTIASILNMIELGKHQEMSQLYLLNPEVSKIKNLNPHDKDIKSKSNLSISCHPIHTSSQTIISATQLILNIIEVIFSQDVQSWTAPFVMGAVNTRVVRRSAAILYYGPKFVS